jgi:hypothetical protein
MTVSSLEASQVKNLGIVAIVVVVLLGLLIARLVSKLIIRVVVLVVAVALAVVVYNQRSSVEDAATNARKQCDISFFGIHVTPSDPTIKAKCKQQLNK